MKKIALSAPLLRSIGLAALFTLPLAVFAQTPQTASFQPLTSIPGIAEAAQAANLPAFLNTLYKICIGAAGVLAVLQIIRGGMTYMLGDSVFEKREARHHIALAIFGLVLVLSPAIVFGIIDPRILDLKVDTSVLTPDSAGSGSGPSANGSDSGASGWTSSDAGAAATCREQGGTVVDNGNGSVTCHAASARTEPFPTGSTGITADEYSACRAQTNCQVEARTRGQYVCQCAGDLPEVNVTNDLGTGGAADSTN